LNINTPLVNFNYSIYMNYWFELDNPDDIFLARNYLKTKSIAAEIILLRSILDTIISLQKPD